jgi:hypothetical protein
MDAVVYAVVDDVPLLLALVEVPPPTVNVVSTTGQRPYEVHDLKWMVWVPLPMLWFVVSMSYGVTPGMKVLLLSIE